MAAGAVVLLGLFAVTKSIADPDFWWHLRAGQLLVSQHHLIGLDPFTYTVSTHHWTMHEWLTEVIFALLFSAGGLGLIVILFALVTWGGLICIALRAQVERPSNIIFVIGFVWALVTGYPVWGPRTQMITFALSCLVLLMAERHLRYGGRRIWLLIPLFLVWSNLHSGFVAGIGFLLVIIVAELAGKALRWSDGANLRRVGDLGIVTALGTLAAMVNPNGPGIVLYPFGTVGSAEQEQLIQEWHSPDFHDFIIRAGFAPMLATLILFIVINRRIRARDAALFAVTTILSLQSERNIALFVAASTPIWITQASQLWRRIWTPPVRSFPRPRAGPRALALVTTVIVFGVMASVDGLALKTDAAVTPTSLGYARDQPVCAARWLAASPLKLNIFNQYGEGGYLLYTLYSHGDKVFIFGDAALMGDQQLLTYGNVEELNPDWDRIITNAKTDVVLFDLGTPFANVLDASPRWVRVYTDAKSAVWVERDSVLRQQLNMPASANGAQSGVCKLLAQRGMDG